MRMGEVDAGLFLSEVLWRRLDSSHKLRVIT